MRAGGGKQKGAQFERHFWSKVKTTRNCWIFQGTILSNGYGQFWNGVKKIGAHVFAYMCSHGPVPTGALVLHECDNRKCVRPSHLFLGDHADNYYDALKKNRHTHGSMVGNSKLKEKDIPVIRRLRKTKTLKEVAAIYDVHFSLISLISRKEIWRHV